MRGPRPAKVNFRHPWRKPVAGQDLTVTSSRCGANHGVAICRLVWSRTREWAYRAAGRQEVQRCEFSTGLPGRQLVVSPQFLVDSLAAPGSVEKVANHGRPRQTPEQRATPARPARQAKQARYPSRAERRSAPGAGASASQRRAVLAKAPPWTTACRTRFRPPTSAGRCWKSAAP
jgi:hypothetical protein